MARVSVLFPAIVFRHFVFGIVASGHGGRGWTAMDFASNAAVAELVN